MQNGPRIQISSLKVQCGGEVCGRLLKLREILSERMKAR